MRKKIRRKNLTDLKKTMCVIDFSNQSGYVGGAYGDISDPYSWEDYSMEFKWSNPNGYYLGGTDGNIYQNGISLGTYVGGTYTDLYKGGTYTGGTDYSGGTDSGSNYYNNNYSVTYYDSAPNWFSDSYGRWERLNSKEKNIILWHDDWYKAKDVYLNSMTAEKKTQEVWGGNYKGDESDAFRHALWSALNAQKVGKAFALKWSDAHEYSTDKDEVDTDLVMDIHNNDIGVEIGFANPNVTIEELSTLIKARIAKGDLIIIRNGKLTKSNGEELTTTGIRRYDTSKEIKKSILN